MSKPGLAGLVAGTKLNVLTATAVKGHTALPGLPVIQSGGRLRPWIVVCSWFTLLMAPVLGWSAVAPHDLFRVPGGGAGADWRAAALCGAAGRGLLLVLLLAAQCHPDCGRALHLCPACRSATGQCGFSGSAGRATITTSSGTSRRALCRRFWCARFCAHIACRGSRWLGFLVVSVCLAFSALYELIEWWRRWRRVRRRTIFSAHRAMPRGDADGHGEALVGILALLLAKAHDRSLAKVIGKPLISANQR